MELSTLENTQNLGSTREWSGTSGESEQNVGGGPLVLGGPYLPRPPNRRPIGQEVLKQNQGASSELKHLVFGDVLCLCGTWLW